MAIPTFNEQGWLPEGVYECTLDEAAARFGGFQQSDRRPQLWARFVEFVREAQACGLIDAIVLNGSFVSAAPAPNDIDLILVVSTHHDYAVDFQPSEYNVLSKRWVHQRFGFDLLNINDIVVRQLRTNFSPGSKAPMAEIKSCTSGYFLLGQEFQMLRLQLPENHPQLSASRPLHLLRSR